MVTPRHYSSKFGSAANAVNGFRERIERMLSTDLAALPGNPLTAHRPTLVRASTGGLLVCCAYLI